MPDKSSARSRKAGAAKQQAEAPNASPATRQMRLWRSPLGIAASVFVSFVTLAGVAWWVLREPQLVGKQLEFAQRTTANTTTPSVYSYRVIQKHKHDPKAFTQGLFWLNGTFYESTGLYGKSAVREVTLDGEVVREARLHGKDFGEGIVYWRGEILQLLWLRGDGYRFSAQAGPGGHLKKKKKAFKHPFQDGWGIAEDGESILVTDNGPDVCFLDPADFATRRCIRVRDAGHAVEMSNELEMIDGELWANIFGKDCIARIAPETGEVRSWVVLTGLLDRSVENLEAKRAHRDPPDVLNGIAWDPEGRRLFVTGKLWPYLFEIELLPVTTPIAQVRDLCIPTQNIFGPMKEPPSKLR